MTINLSASLIKDYLTCHARAGYRLSHREEAVPSIEMAIGSAVHEALEKAHLPKKQAVASLKNIYRNFSIFEDKDILKANSFIDSFYDMFPEDFFSESDKVEQYFKLPYGKEVFLTGRIDRIHDGVVFDWKTSKNPPLDVNRDPQFILYYIAYNKMFKERPKSVAYVALKQKRVYYYKAIAPIVTEFEEKIIPEITANLRSGKLARTGLFGYKACDYCSFKELCWSQLGY